MCTGCSALLPTVMHVSLQVYQIGTLCKNCYLDACESSRDA